MKEYHRSLSYHRSGRKKSRSRDRGSYREKIRNNGVERHSQGRTGYDLELREGRSEFSRNRSRSNHDKRSSGNRERSSSSSEEEYYNSKRRKEKSTESKQCSKSSHRRLSISSSPSGSGGNSYDNSHNSESSSKLSRGSSKTRESSVDDKPLANKTLSNLITVNEIDLLDTKVREVLETIEEDSFVQKTFCKVKNREAQAPPTSSPRSSLSSQEKATVNDKVIINLNAETITVPKCSQSSIIPLNNGKDEIFHINFLGDAEQKPDKWIRKLFLYRQKYMKH